MKKILLSALIILCCISQSQARMNVTVAGGGVPAAAALCSSCTPGDPADVWCEDFKGAVECISGSGASDSFCRCAWTNACAEQGAYTFSDGLLTIAVTGTPGSACVGVTRSLSPETAFYLKFKLNITSESLSDGQTAQIGGVNHSSGEEVLKLVQTSGSLYLNLNFNANTITGSTAIDGVDDIIEIYVNEAAETMQMWVNGTSQGTATANYEALTTLFIGSYHPAAVITYTITDIQVDDDTRP